MQGYGDTSVRRATCYVLEIGGLLGLVGCQPSCMFSGRPYLKKVGEE